MPWMIVALVATELIGMAEVATALLVLTLFTCYLRPSEGLSLDVADLVPLCLPSALHYALILHPEEQGVVLKAR